MDKRSDEKLLGSFVEGRDQAAFEELVRRHERLVVSVCLRVLDDRQDALDAAQAAFLALAMKADRLDRARPLAPWLHRVAHAAAVSARRSREARKAREREAALAGRPAPDDGELRALLDREIDALPERYRRPVVMVHLEGKSLEEAAAALGTTSGTVGSWLSRGREKLRARLARRGAVVAPAILVAALSSTSDAASGGFAAWTARAAAGLARGSGAGGCAGAHVVGLAKGALQMIFWAKLKSAAVVAAAGMLCVAAGIGAARAGEGRPTSEVEIETGPATASVTEVATAVEFATDALPQEPPKPSTPDLVGHWTFDEAEGEEVKDATGQGHHGKLQGAVRRVEGKRGKALAFDGGGGHVELFAAPALDGLQKDNYTVAAWFRPENFPPGSEDANDATYGIVLKSGWHLGLAYNGEGKFIMTHWTGPEQWVGAGSWEDTYSPGRWHHVAGVVDRAAGTVKLFVDGEEKGTADFPANAETKPYETTWKIGIGGPGAEKWAWPAKAMIDDVRLYRRALAADELKALYEGK